VRKLFAVETLGSTTVICTDKTGTLTLGEMTVQALYVDGESYTVTGDGYSPMGEVHLRGKKVDVTSAPALQTLATVIVACNNAHLVDAKGWKAIGDPTEGALLAAGLKAGANRDHVERDLPKHHEIPFDSDRKRSAVIRTLPEGKLRAYLDGAPACCSTSPPTCTPALAFARSPVPTATPSSPEPLPWRARPCACSAPPIVIWTTPRPPTSPRTRWSATSVFVGLSGMHDPPRAEAQQAVRQMPRRRHPRRHDHRRSSPHRHRHRAGDRHYH